MNPDATARGQPNAAEVHRRIADRIRELQRERGGCGRAGLLGRALRRLRGWSFRRWAMAHRRAASPGQ